METISNLMRDIILWINLKRGTIAITACILMASTLGAVHILYDIRLDWFISIIIVLALEATMIVSGYGILIIMKRESKEMIKPSWGEALLGIPPMSKERRKAGKFYAMNTWGVFMMALLNSLEGWKRLKDVNVIQNIAQDYFGAWALVFIAFTSMTLSLLVLYGILFENDIWEDTEKAGKSEKNVGSAILSGRGMGFRDDEWRELEAQGLGDSIRELYHNAPTKEAKQAVVELCLKWVKRIIFRENG